MWDWPAACRSDTCRTWRPAWLPWQAGPHWRSADCHCPRQTCPCSPPRPGHWGNTQWCEDFSNSQSISTGCPADDSSRNLDRKYKYRWRRTCRGLILGRQICSSCWCSQCCVSPAVTHSATSVSFFIAVLQSKFNFSDFLLISSFRVQYKEN